MRRAARVSPMIVCHKHRFIFIATRKTSASAIEDALSAFCADGDIVTATTPVAVTRYRPVDWLRLLARGERARLDRHESAAAIRDRVGEQTWNSYFKFCVERDPWEKAVALYEQRTRALDPRPSMLEFLTKARPGSLSNFPLYSIDGALAVDRVIRYEHLDAELDAVGHLLNLPGELSLATPRPEAVACHYSAVIGPAERALIDAVCAREIETFGYAFREVAPEDR
jgi:hypothetical protein